MKIQVFFFCLFLVIPWKSDSVTINHVFHDPFIIDEELPVGTQVLNVAQLLKLNELNTFDYKFGFHENNQLVNTYFSIDQLTGVLSIKKSMDLEELCNNVCSCQSNNCSILIEIEISGHSLIDLKIVEVSVILKDINEFSPQFPKDNIHLNVSEGLPLNFEIPLESAIDLDAQSNLILYKLTPILSINNKEEYKIELDNLNSQFLLDFSVKNQLTLILLKSFDYEIQKQFNFKIIATDSDDLNRTGFCMINIKIIDVNDNFPVFEANEYEHRLDESQALPDTRLLRVRANDLDDGINGIVKYELVDQSMTQNYTVNDLFKIDSLTGWISIGDKFKLDFETKKTYRFRVKAQDSALSFSMSVYAFVSIHLNDVNDNYPLINASVPISSRDKWNINFSNNILEISESIPPNSYLLQISTNDFDSSENGRVNVVLRQYKLKGDHKNVDLRETSNDFVIYQFSRNNFRLLTKNHLDADMHNKYILDIIASDQGLPNLQTTISIDIIIKDENDNPPIFLSSVYRFDCFEITGNLGNDANDWTFIGKIEAVDSDILNKRIVYTIEDLVISNECKTSKDLFRIDSDTGLVQAKKKALDREMCEQFHFTISANDGLHKVFVKMILTLFDINDNAPKFLEKVILFEINENNQILDSFGSVKATDADKPESPFSKIQYEITNVTNLEDIKKKIKLDLNNGELKQLEKFNLNDTNPYEFFVIAYDNLNSSSNTLNSTCLISIRIIFSKSESTLATNILNISENSIQDGVNELSILKRQSKQITSLNALESKKKKAKGLSCFSGEINKEMAIINSTVCHTSADTCKVSATLFQFQKDSNLCKDRQVKCLNCVKFFTKFNKILQKNAATSGRFNVLTLQGL
jgi:hypothetical protein